MLFKIHNKQYRNIVAYYDPSKQKLVSFNLSHIGKLVLLV